MKLHKYSSNFGGFGQLHGIIFCFLFIVAKYVILSEKKRNRVMVGNNLSINLLLICAQISVIYDDSKHYI